MNELTIIFDRLGMPTREVLQGAITKWNFLPFTPGLAGGHCIGVDPITWARAEAAGHYPRSSSPASMTAWGLHRAASGKLLIAAERPVKGARIGILHHLQGEGARSAQHIRIGADASVVSQK